MEFGDQEPSTLPSSNVLRVAKSKAVKESRLHDDPILAINMLKYIDPYSMSIKDIGYDRFFVHYWASSEMAVYKSFIKETEVPQISIDATGGIVKKILNASNNRSHNILLYEVTVNDVKNKTQFDVCHMLSERHDNNSIYHWLAEWIRDGAPKPKVIVSDQSLALLYAIVRAFTQYGTLQDYLKACFYIICKNEPVNSFIPSCFIRCDVAHIIKLFTTWPPFKNTHKRVKLYVRSFALIIQETNFENVLKLLKAIFDIMFSETEGLIIGTQLNTSCENSKCFLKNRIANISVDLTTITESGNINDINDENVFEKNYLTEESDELEIPYSHNDNFEAVINALADERKSKVSLEEGDHGNLHYLPSLSK